MATPKTQATAASVDDYLAARASSEQRADCHWLMATMQQITGDTPTMWGPSIVGFGRYTYRYESGHSGAACVTGFAIRGRELVIYLLMEGDAQANLLTQLGKHKIGKACLYIKRLADLDTQVLTTLITESVAAVRRKYPT
jgi:hypothetical protein